MRTFVVALVILASSAASAQPVPAPTPPGETPRTAATPAFHPHLEVAVRGGIHSTAITQSDDAGAGTGPLIEAEIAWRFADWVSLGGFGSWAQLTDDVTEPFSPYTVTTVHSRYIDVGARLTLHHAGFFFGGGLAAELTHDWYMGGTRDDSGVFSELHAGYTSPKIESLHCSVEVMVMIGTANTEHPGRTVDTKRIGIGLRF